MDGAETFELVAGMVWGVVAVVCGFYFIGCYLLEILAQKLDEPRWMAWIPIANGYLTFRLAGWGGWFGALIAGWVLAGVASAISPGFALIIMIPVGLATIIISFMIWLKIAERRGLSQMVGLLIVAPNFVPLLEVVLPTGGLLTIGSWLASLLAFAYLVFYDGSPEHSPHFVGYVVTTCLAAAIGLPMVMLADDPEFMEGFQSGFEAAQSGETMEGEDLWDDFGLEAEETETAAAPQRVQLSTYEPPADACANGARASGKRPPEGSHWWCEAMIAGEWQRHGPVRKWFDNGSVASEGTYKAGVEDGTWTRYWKTGGAKVRADFRDGQQHGWMRSWDEVGRLESEVYYEYGQPTTLPASN
jgi:hypothetical protein